MEEKRQLSRTKVELMDKEKTIKGDQSRIRELMATLEKTKGDLRRKEAELAKGKQRSDATASGLAREHEAIRRERNKMRQEIEEQAEKDRASVNAQRQQLLAEKEQLDRRTTELEHTTQQLEDKLRQYRVEKHKLQSDKEYLSRKKSKVHEQHNTYKNFYDSFASQVAQTLSSPHLPPQDASRSPTNMLHLSSPRSSHKRSRGNRNAIPHTTRGGPAVSYHEREMIRAT